MIASNLAATRARQLARPLLLALVMRTSSYVIHVDLPDQPDDVLLVHGYSGAYDVVSRSVASYLRANEPARHKPAVGEWPAEPVASADAPSEQTIERLKKRGYLTDQTIAEERERVRALANMTHTHELQRKPDYIFMVTYDCNLRCNYCFQDHMRTDPTYRHLLKAMDKAMIDRAVKAMANIDTKHRNAIGPREITIFGGEPLLAQNRPVIEYLIQRINETGGARVYAITNGTELEHFLDLLRPGAIDAIQVTIDGPPEEHDKRRIRPDGTGSFDAIIKNLVRAAECNVDVHVRINTDRYNVERLHELARELCKYGLDKKLNFRAYSTAVHAATEKIEKGDTLTQYGLTKRLNELRETYPEMRVINRPVDDNKIRLRKIMQRELEPWRAFRASYCGAHASMYVFDPFGDIYACWERTGDPSTKIGAIDADGNVELIHSPEHIEEPAKRTPNGKRKFLPVLETPKIAGVEAWRTRTFATNETCLSCKYAFYCGGGCAAEALDSKGEYYTNHCSGFQERFRVAAAETFLEVRAGIRVNELASSTCGA